MKQLISVHINIDLRNSNSFLSAMFSTTLLTALRPICEPKSVFPHTVNGSRVTIFSAQHGTQFSLQKRCTTCACNNWAEAFQFHKHGELSRETDSRHQVEYDSTPKRLGLKLLCIKGRYHALLMACALHFIRTGSIFWFLQPFSILQSSQHTHCCAAMIGDAPTSKHFPACHSIRPLFKTKQKTFQSKKNNMWQYAHRFLPHQFFHHKCCPRCSLEPST